MSIHIINPDKTFNPLLENALKKMNLIALDIDDLSIPSQQKEESMKLLRESADLVTYSSDCSSKHFQEILKIADTVFILDMRAYFVRRYLKALRTSSNIDTLLNQTLTEYEKYLEQFDTILEILQQTHHAIERITVNWEKVSNATPSDLFLEAAA